MHSRDAAVVDDDVDTVLGLSAKHYALTCRGNGGETLVGTGSESKCEDKLPADFLSRSLHHFQPFCASWWCDASRFKAADAILGAR